MEDQAAFLQYLKIINQEARDIVGCDRATLFLVDASAKVVFAKVVEGMPPIRVPFGVGFAGSAAEGGGILINVVDAYDDERFNPACKFSLQFGTTRLYSHSRRSPVNAPEASCVCRSGEATPRARKNSSPFCNASTNCKVHSMTTTRV